MNHGTDLANGCSQDEDDPDVIKWSETKTGKSSGLSRTFTLQQNKKLSKDQYAALVDMLDQQGLPTPPGGRKALESTAELTDDYKADLEEARHSVLLVLH